VVGAGPVPIIVTVCVPEVLGKKIVMETSVLLNVPVGIMEVTAASPPTHCERSLEKQTRVFGTPVNVFPLAYSWY